jgi:hypothetical protein
MAAESSAEDGRPATERLVLVGEESISLAKNYGRVGSIYSEGYTLYWLLVPSGADVGEDVDVVASCDSTPSGLYVYAPHDPYDSDDPEVPKAPGGLKAVPVDVPHWRVVCDLGGVASLEDLPEEGFKAWAFSTRMNASKVCTAETLFMESRGIPFAPPPIRFWKDAFGSLDVKYSVGDIPDEADPPDGRFHKVLTCYPKMFPRPFFVFLDFGSASYSLEIRPEWDADLKRWRFEIAETDDREGKTRTVTLKQL